MRVALVSEHASPLALLGGVDAGGQNVHVGALAAALARRGDEVVVHTRRDDPALPEVVRVDAGVRIHHVDAGPAEVISKDLLLPYMGAFGDELARAWQGWRPDIVHAHFWMSGIASLRAARPLGLPVLQTFHALGVEKRRHHGAADTSPPERVALEGAIAAEVERIVATASHERFLLAAMGIPPSLVSVVPCGVDLERFQPDGPVAPRGGRRRILAVGRLVERKGVRDVVEALAGVPGAELVVAGGAYRSELEGDPEARALLIQAARCGVADRLDLRGRVSRDELPALVRSADVVVAVPWYEPFGIVPLEAMACGRPVVGSAVGGLLDTIVDGVTGRHVPPRDPAALAGVLRELLADAALLRRLGDAGLRRARARFGWDQVAAATRDLYAGVLTRRVVPRPAEEALA
jgi:glycosyltransferase involved in cell wall biosynthesis